MDSYTWFLTHALEIGHHGNIILSTPIWSMMCEHSYGIMVLWYCDGFAKNITRCILSHTYKVRTYRLLTLCYPHRSEVASILSEVQGNTLPLFKFIEIYEKRCVSHSTGQSRLFICLLCCDIFAANKFLLMFSNKTVNLYYYGFPHITYFDEKRVIL